MTLTTDWIVPISIGLIASFIALLVRRSPKPVPIRIKNDRRRR